MLDKRELEIKKGLENDPWFGFNKDITLDELKSRQEVLEHIFEEYMINEEIIKMQEEVEKANQEINMDLATYFMSVICIIAFAFIIIVGVLM